MQLSQSSMSRLTSGYDRVDFSKLQHIDDPSIETQVNYQGLAESHSAFPKNISVPSGKVCSAEDRNVYVAVLTLYFNAVRVAQNKGPLQNLPKGTRDGLVKCIKGAKPRDIASAKRWFFFASDWKNKGLHCIGPKNTRLQGVFNYLVQSEAHADQLLQKSLEVTAKSLYLTDFVAEFFNKNKKEEEGPVDPFIEQFYKNQNQNQNQNRREAKKLNKEAKKMQAREEALNTEVIKPKSVRGPSSQQAVVRDELAELEEAVAGIKASSKGSDRSENSIKEEEVSAKLDRARLMSLVCGDIAKDFYLGKDPAFTDKKKGTYEVKMDGVVHSTEVSIMRGGMNRRIMPGYKMCLTCGHRTIYIYFEV